MSGTLEIRAALIQRLTAVAPGAAVPAASTAWENKTFTPTTGTRYYRATFLPGEPTVPEIGEGSPNRQVGVFQIDVFDPPNQGDVKTATEAERIVACFKRGTVLTYSGVSVQITQVYRKQGTAEDSWYHVPVIVMWRADVAN